MIENTIEIPVQVNGKMRGTVTVPSDAPKDDILTAAKDLVKDKFPGNVVKEIYVPGKIVNLIIK